MVVEKDPWAKHELGWGGVWSPRVIRLELVELTRFRLAPLVEEDSTQERRYPSVTQEEDSSQGQWLVPLQPSF